MTLPVSNNERILNLYDRANNLRLNNEFDKASGVYETILEIENDQIEAHWGLILCKYGVEYVDDPKTKNKIPTCHRTIDTSILTDSDFKYIRDNSYGESLNLYEKEAREINNIQKRILEISSKESPYDIFICYKETDNNGKRTKDSVLAEEIYNELVKENYKVFFSKITLEDKLGEEYEPYIYNALTSSKVMIVVTTSYEHVEAVWVKNEWSRYLELIKKNSNKKIIPVYKDMDAYELPESLNMYQSVNMNNVGAVQDLVRGVKKLIKASKNTDEVTEEMYNKVKTMMENEDGILSAPIIKEKTKKVL